MIGKIGTGRSFSGCINYCLEDKLLRSQEAAFKNRAEILNFNQCFGNKKELIQQFNEVRRLNPGLSKPVLHITLSLAPNEKPDKGTWSEIAEDCAKHFGFDKNQFITVSHADTSHPHLHIIANRIGFNKKTVSDSNNYKKMAAWCRQMEQKYNLQQVLSPRKFLSKEMRQIPRSDARKEAMKNDVKVCLVSSKNYNEFEAFMKQKSYQVIKGRGIAFIDSKGVYVKGSELGFSLAKVEKILQLSLYQKQTLFNTAKPQELLQKTGAHFKQMEVESLSKELSQDLKPKRSKILSDLLKPVQTDSTIPFELN
jgi:Relaxase/Mobilisation nuclease domain